MALAPCRVRPSLRLPVAPGLKNAPNPANLTKQEKSEGHTSATNTSGEFARRMLSAKAEQFTESVIREMTRLALEHQAVNLSQGFPDFAAPAEIKEAARQAIADDINQYAITWGAKALRDAIVEKFIARRAFASIQSAKSPSAAGQRKR